MYFLIGNNCVTWVITISPKLSMNNSTSAYYSDIKHLIIMHNDSAVHVLQSGLLNQVPFDPLGMSNRKKHDCGNKHLTCVMTLLRMCCSQASSTRSPLTPWA